MHLEMRMSGPKTDQNGKEETNAEGKKRRGKTSSLPGKAKRTPAKD